MIKEHIGCYGLAATCPDEIGQILRLFILVHLNIQVLSTAGYLLLLLIRDMLRHHYQYLVAFTTQFRNQELNFQQESNYDSDLELYLTFKPKQDEILPCRILPPVSNILCAQTSAHFLCSSPNSHSWHESLQALLFLKNFGILFS